MKKSILLIFTLAIPVSIFIFLKLFGTNTFEVPPLFENGIPDCSNSSGAHIIPGINYLVERGKQLNTNELKGYIVYGVLDAESPEQNSEIITELIRIQDAFFELEAPYFLILVKGSHDQRNAIESQCKTLGLAHKNSAIIYMENMSFYSFLKCGIALIDKNTEAFTNLVLTDPDKRIRGIYNGLDTEKTDQLIMELKILKQNS